MNFLKPTFVPAHASPLQAGVGIYLENYNKKAARATAIRRTTTNSKDNYFSSKGATAITTTATASDNNNNCYGQQNNSLIARAQTIGRIAKPMANTENTKPYNLHQPE